MTEILLIYDTGCNLDSHCLVRINVQAILETGISPLSSIDVDLHNYTSVISSGKSGFVSLLCQFFFNQYLKRNHTKSQL